MSFDPHPTKLFCVALAACAALARADSLWITSDTTSVQYDQVKIVGVDHDQVTFHTSQGNESTQPMAKVARLAIDDEKSLTAAEQARSLNQWDIATDDYSRTLSSTSKPWLKDWVALRLLESAGRANRFDMAVTAYIAVASKSPAYAISHKPALPDAKSTFLDTALGQLDIALAHGPMADEQKQALLWLELDICRARNDTAKSAEIAKKLAALKPTDTTPAPDPTLLLADLKLNSANAAIKKGDYAKAIAEVESAKSAFVDPAHQADALFCLAQARLGLARQNKSPDALKDAALAYLRVAAQMQDNPPAPHVPESLLAAASIMEQLDDRAGAVRLYQEIISRYNTHAEAVTAKQAIARLGSAAVKP